jgi:hypothetical protein
MPQEQVTCMGGDDDLSQCSTLLETFIRGVDGRMYHGPPTASSEPSPSEQAALLSLRRRLAALVAASPQQQVTSTHSDLTECLPIKQRLPHEHNIKRKGPSESAPSDSPESSAKRKGSKIGHRKQKGSAIIVSGSLKHKGSATAPPPRSPE